MKRFNLLVCFATVAYVGCARSPVSEENQPPEIRSLRLSVDPVPASEEVLLLADVVDPDGDALTSTWRINRGELMSSSLDSALWFSPDSAAFVRWIYEVEDSGGLAAADTLSFWVENRPPTITRLDASETVVLNGNTIRLHGAAVDPDSHSFDLRWNTPFGWLHALEGDSVDWTVPDSTFRAWVELQAVDRYGATSHDTLTVTVYREVGCAWILNEGQQEIVKLSRIGDELLRLGGFTDLQDLDVDPENRRLWVVEGNPPALHAFDLRGTPLFTYQDGLARPTRVKAWTRTGSAFVLDADNANIVEINIFGDRVLRTLAGFHRPNALDLHQSTGALWICDEGANLLYHVNDGWEGDIAQVDSSEHVIRRDGYLYPVDVAVEDSTGACWLADKEGGFLVRYEPDASDSLVVHGFQNPVAISAAWSDGLCWVLDRGLDSHALRLFFDQAQLDVGGLSFPKHLAYNRIDAHCWVLDSERNRVLRLDPQGSIVGSWTDFDFPTRIVINGGY